LHALRETNIGTLKSNPGMSVPRHFRAGTAAISTQTAMLVATCCGASTFAFDFTHLVASAGRRTLFSPDKELNKVVPMKRALDNVHA
jgi:hypothetical protein